MCTYAMGLEGVVTEQTTTPAGGITVEGWPYPINCWRGPPATALETFRDGLCNSCNPYTIYIGSCWGRNLRQIPGGLRLYRKHRYRPAR